MEASSANLDDAGEVPNKQMILVWTKRSMRKKKKWVAMTSLMKKMLMKQQLNEEDNRIIRLTQQDPD